MDLLKRFFKFIKTNHLPLGEQTRALLTVSGGLDSVVMAHLFEQAGFPFAIAHCNFQLRGAETDGDELFVQKIALDYDVPFFVKRFETKDHAEENQMSTQMAARELRYAWFEQIAEESDFEFIVTAHHLNDSVETSLWNFTRGTGLAGLSGIAPRSGNLIRPLLFATKQEILEYALVHKLDCREDSSNASDDYTRNFIRHHIVPRFEALNPSFLRTAERNMARIEEAEANLTYLLQHWFYPSGNGSDLLVQGIDKQMLALLPSPEQALRHLLQPYGFDSEQTRQLSENIDHVGFELQTTKGYRLLVDRKTLMLSLIGQADLVQPIFIQEGDLMVRLPDGSQVFFLPTSMPVTPIHTPEDSNSVLIDAGKLQFPLQLRHWMPGDSFHPLGMQGKKQKLQDFFTNQKISRFEKEAVWLLWNANGLLIWVLGHRLDDRFKLVAETQKVLKLNWIPGEGAELS